MNKPIPINTITPLAVMDRAQFASAVAMAALAVERKNAIPILDNLLIRGDGGSVAVTGTDLDNEIKVTVPGAVDERFAVTLPAHMLDKILGKAKATESAKLSSADGEHCNVALGAANYALQILPAADFPDMIGPGPTKDVTITDKLGRESVTMVAQPYFTFSMAASDLAYALGKVKFAVSVEETRYYLNGIYLHPLHGTLRFVATDGHRLGVFEAAAKALDAAMPGMVLPSRAVGLLLKILPKLKDASVLVEVSNIKARFRMGGVLLTCKVIDGTFPDYTRVMPRSNDKTLSAKVKVVDEAIEQVTLISGDRARAVRFDMSAGKLRLSVTNPDAGTAQVALSCGWTAEEMAIGLNSQYLRDILAEITGAEFEADFNDAASPVLFRDPADPRFTAVLMPMRI